MIVGHTLTILICVGAGILHIKSPTLPFSVDGCSENVWEQVTNRTEIYAKGNVTVNAVQPEMYVSILTFKTQPVVTKYNDDMLTL